MKTLTPLKLAILLELEHSDLTARGLHELLPSRLRGWLERVTDHPPFGALFDLERDGVVVRRAGSPRRWVPRRWVPEYWCLTDLGRTLASAARMIERMERESAEAES